MTMVVAIKQGLGSGIREVETANGVPPRDAGQLRSIAPMPTKPDLDSVVERIMEERQSLLRELAK